MHSDMRPRKKQPCGCFFLAHLSDERKVNFLD